MTDYQTVENGTLKYNYHAGQLRAWDAEARFVLVLAGTQSGKTVFGPPWMLREIQQRGAGDYLVVAPTYPTLNKKVLPEFRALFEQKLNLGEYKVADRIFKFYDGETKVFFGHATDPDSLESATAKGAWLDECGQDGFKLASWEAIQRRLSIHQGRVLMTTTPYNLGWLKTQVYDRWRNGDKDYQVVHFKSSENPAFPMDEYERARATLPGWKFRMFYEAEFTRPAGLIYDCFDFDRHVVPPFGIPDHWRRYGGIDFGGVNTAALLLVQNPDNGTCYLIDEYHQGGLPAKGHAANLKPWRVSIWVGGAKSEGQWRNEFSTAGLPITGPDVHEVEVGIDRIYALIQSGKLYVFSTCAGVLDELGSYSRTVDENGEVTAKIKDKETYHHLDALRYVGTLLGTPPQPLPAQPRKKSTWNIESDGRKDGKWI